MPTELILSQYNSGYTITTLEINKNLNLNVKLLKVTNISRNIIKININYLDLLINTED